MFDIVSSSLILSDKVQATVASTSIKAETGRRQQKQARQGLVQKVVQSNDQNKCNGQIHWINAESYAVLTNGASTSSVEEVAQLVQ